MRIRIKTWEEMEREFGTDRDGDIIVRGCGSFIQDMKKLCGTEIEVIKKGYGRAITFDNEGNSWIISPFMVDRKDLDKFLTLLYK